MKIGQTTEFCVNFHKYKIQHTNIQWILYEKVMTLLIWLPPRCGHLDRGGDALYILDLPMTW